MGTLKPGAQYIYERADGVTYAREMGADPSTRQAIGWDFNKDDPNFDPRTTDGRPLIDKMREDQLWGEIRRAAKNNPALQKALENCIIVYKLTKDYEKLHGNKT
jgi:hypothetical protein